MKINPNDMVLLTSGMTVRATTPVEGGKFQGKAIVGDPAMPPLEYSLSDVFATFKFTGHHNELVQQMIDQEGIQALHENIFLSARGNSSNTDVLVVRFRSASQMSGEAFLASLRQAVTRWMMQTYEGRVAWEKAEGHFFLEHLIPSLEDRHLPILLSNFGINELKIAVLTPMPRATERMTTALRPGEIGRAHV